MHQRQNNEFKEKLLFFWKIEKNVIALPSFAGDLFHIADPRREMEYFGDKKECFLYRD